VSRHYWGALSALFTGLALAASATTVPAMNFEELVDRSEAVVAGHVTRSWSAWDAGHNYIWTHYEINVAGAAKGRTGATVVVSEPGGVIGNQAMDVAGVVSYAVGENVTVVLERMPNGYLRTAGWGQGKLTVDSMNRVHVTTAANGAEVIASSRQAAGEVRTPLRALDGMKVADVTRRVAARVSFHHGAAK
jgi:hypothetical protein